MNDCTTCDSRLLEINRLRKIVREYNAFSDFVSKNDYALYNRFFAEEGASVFGRGDD